MVETERKAYGRNKHISKNMFLARKATLNPKRNSCRGLALVCDFTAMNGEDPPVKGILSKNMFLVRKATLNPKRKSCRGLALVCDSTAMNGEDPPVNSILMLPDDMLLNCLSRISRLCYPTLFLVSKRFRSLFTSTELYQTRALLGRTESCLYVCLQSSTDSSNPLYWFTLSRRPNSLVKFLVPVSSSNSPYDSRSVVVVVGPNIYAIGGLINYKNSTRVMVMDCHSHTWREAPSLRVARVLPSACVLDGKIYVMGGCDKPNSTNWIEVFDTNTQTWEVLQIPNKEIWRGSRYESVVYEGTLYVRSGEKRVTYKLCKGRWREADLAMDMGWAWSVSYCVIANMFYRWTLFSIDWYDPKERLWRALKGLEGLKGLPSFYHNANVKMVDYGGKMVVLWEKGMHVENHQQKVIWCAEIVLKRRQHWAIWGTLEWYGKVFISSEPYGLVHALATTI